MWKRRWSSEQDLPQQELRLQGSPGELRVCIPPKRAGLLPVPLAEGRMCKRILRATLSDILG